MYQAAVLILVVSVNIVSLGVVKEANACGNGGNFMIAPDGRCLDFGSSGNAPRSQPTTQPPQAKPAPQGRSPYEVESWLTDKAAFHACNGAGKDIYKLAESGIAYAIRLSKQLPANEKEIASDWQYYALTPVERRMKSICPDKFQAEPIYRDPFPDAPDINRKN